MFTTNFEVTSPEFPRLDLPRMRKLIGGRSIMQLPVALDLATVFPSFFEQLGLPLIFLSSFTEWPFQPSRKPTGVNREHIGDAL